MTVRDWCMDRPWRLCFQVRVRAPGAQSALTPVELPDLDLQAITPNAETADPNSFVLVRCDGKNRHPLVFDPKVEGERAYAVPHRFEPDYEGQALPLRIRKGKLVFPTPSHPGEYLYHLYFKTSPSVGGALAYHGVVGDGDELVQAEGRLAMAGMAQPVEYGRHLFGRKGLLAGCYYRPARFFENVAHDGDDPCFVDRGSLRDRDSEEITGTPTLVDWDRDGRLHLVVGNAQNGTLYLHRNSGTNDDPVFAPREPLRHEDGSDLCLVDYLRGMEVPCLRPDGTVNPIYPRTSLVQVHGGKIHVHAIPQFVDWAGSGRLDLLVGTAGEFVVHFERRGDTFAPGQFLRDDNGEVIRPGSCIQVVDWNGDGQPDLIAAEYLGFVNLWEFAGLRDGAPAFRPKGRVSVAGKDVRMDAHPHPLLLDWGDGRGRALLVGESHGEVWHYPVIGQECGAPRFGPGSCLRMRHAKIVRNMAACHYVDVDGDGTKDLLAGDLCGGVYYYRNLGTDRNPIFKGVHQLNDEEGPIKIEGGPDPHMPQDGYSKPAPCDLTDDGRTHFVVGTGFGRIYYYRNMGSDAQGRPTFARGRVLRDTEGNEIMSHHMSSASVADWDGDGLPDLLVGGQPNVHALKDDDPDPDTRVRLYRGVGRGKDGVLQFAPYVAFECEGDRELSGRPKPIMGVWQGEQALFINNAIFVRCAGEPPERLRFVGSFPPTLSKARHNIIPADYTFSTLAEDDPLVLRATCISTVHAFRWSFLLNRGYLDAAFHLQETEARKADERRRLDSRLERLPRRTPGPARDLRRKSCEVPRVDTAGISRLDARGWERIPPRDDFTTSSPMFAAGPPPAKRCPSLKLARDADFLYVHMRCNEPSMDRVIARAPGDNAYSITTDDRVSVILAPYEQAADADNPTTALIWHVTSRGMKTQKLVGRGSQPAAESAICVDVQRDENGWTTLLGIPFRCFGRSPAPGDIWSFNIWRHRSLYANEVKAYEQRETELLDWGGAWMNIYGGVRLCFRA